MYLPFKPKKRTRATLAKEKGLEPLAEFINRLNQPDAVQQSSTTLIDEAAKFISNEKGVKSAQEALQGASDILAEAVSENADCRALVRDFIFQHGVFVSKIQRAELLNVPKFGAKTFEQAAGFLRIRDGENPLDNTAVHPERYSIVQRIADDLQLPVEHLSKRPDQIKSIDLARYISGDVGEPTLRDILGELQKPGRDPRAEFKYASFKDGVTDLKHLKVGMTLEGVVTNVANFGAFVDIGVHQDGLVHLSQLAERFIKDPNEVVKVGQIVSVRVLEVNETLRRISLSMKKEDARQTPANKNQSHKNQSHENQSQKAKRVHAETRFSIDDLKAKFNRK